MKAASAKSIQHHIAAPAEPPLSAWQPPANGPREVSAPGDWAPTDRLAFDDPELLLHPEARGIRFQLERLKPEIAIRRLGMNKPDEKPGTNWRT